MVEIRVLEPAEIVQFSVELTELLTLVLTENIAQVVTREQIEKYYRDLVRYVDDGSAVVIGALECGRLVGFHWGYETKVFGERRMHSYLNALLVDYRGQGIGSRFFRYLESIALSKGIFLIEAMVTYSNEGAVKYHMNNGFEIERLKVLKRLA